MKKIYLDYAATTPTDPGVVEAMLPYFGSIYGNASSPHSFGQEAGLAVEHARELIASFLGALPEEIIFTSGGTESNNLAIIGVAYALAHKGRHIITSSIEHHSVLEPCAFLEQNGFRITYLPVDQYGVLYPEEVRKAITDQTILISIMHASNEIGTLQPLSPISDIARQMGIYVHSDTIQTFAHLPFTVDELGVSLLSVSGHKLYGPKGVGFLYVRKGTQIAPQIRGGDQEMGRRASTYNVPGIVGLGKAVEVAGRKLQGEMEYLTGLRDKLAEGILTRIERVRLNGHPTTRLPNIVNISFESVDGEAILMNLDAMGIACSSGSACTSSTHRPSHVLRAIGLPDDLAQGSLRLSLGRYTTAEEVAYVIETVPKVVERLRAISPAYSIMSRKIKYRYSPVILEHSEHPLNSGVIEKPDGTGASGNLDSGDGLRMYIRVKDGVITEARCTAVGCGVIIAAGSILTELIKGKTLENILRISSDDIAAALGGVPHSKRHCTALAEEAMRAAISDYRIRCTPQGHSPVPLP